RRSIYPLLAKPVRRSEFILGKFVGLLLTLLVNIIVMTIALYAVLLYLSHDVPPNVQQAWDAPALDPALLKAIGLIYVDLSVVTALAVFFSSYSSPLLSAVFTLGFYLVGQFNADLRHFDRIVSSPAAAAIARACYYVLPDSCTAAFRTRASRAAGTHANLRGAVSAARSHDDARSVFHDCVSVRRDLSGRGLSRRSWTSRSRGRAAAEGARRAAAEMAVH